MTQDEVLNAVLRLKLGGTKEAPSTSVGKFLALALCLRVESNRGWLPDKRSLYSSVQISSHLGVRAYQDLVRCQWIQGRRFEPKVKGGGRVLEHIHVIRYVLNCSQGQANGWLAQWQPKGFSVNNRLLLVILLDQAGPGGMVGPISFGELAKLTGFKPDQIKGQLQRLKEIGLVSGVVPGVTGATLFGKAKSYIYLNFLHPYWSDSFPGWRAVCLDASLWQGITKNEGESLHRLMGASGHAELVKRPELRRYFRNLMLILISGALSRDWHYLRLGDLADTFQMWRAEVGKLLRAELPASFDPWFLLGVADIADLLQSELCKGDSDLMTRIGLDPFDSLGPPRPWHFCVLPQFGNQPQSMVILTNCPHLSGEIDANWLRTRGHDLWVEKGVVTSPDAAPRKLRSRKPKAT